MYFMAKKPKHRTETILLTNSIKILKMVRTHTQKIFFKSPNQHFRFFFLIDSGETG